MKNGAKVTSTEKGRKNVAFDTFIDARTANRYEICLSKRLYFL